MNFERTMNFSDPISGFIKTRTGVKLKWSKPLHSWADTQEKLQLECKLQWHGRVVPTPNVGKGGGGGETERKALQVLGKHCRSYGKTAY